jgi:hypothetical protein
VCGEVTFKSQLRNLTPLNKNIMSFILGAKSYVLGSSYLLPKVCYVPNWLEKWLAPHALRPAFDRTNRPFTRHIWDYLSVHTWWYIRIYLSQRDPFHSEELTVPKPPNNVIKVELMTNFVKAMDQNSEGFLYVKNKFPMLTLNSRKRYLKVLK